MTRQTKKMTITSKQKYRILRNFIDIIAHGIDYF